MMPLMKMIKDTWDINPLQNMNTYLQNCPRHATLGNCNTCSMCNWRKVHNTCIITPALELEFKKYRMRELEQNT